MLGLRHLERKGYAGWTVKWESSSRIQISVILVNHRILRLFLHWKCDSLFFVFTILTILIVCFLPNLWLLGDNLRPDKKWKKKTAKAICSIPSFKQGYFHSMLKSPSHLLYVKNWWSPPHVYLSSFVSIHVDVGVMVNIERHLQLRDSCLLHGNRIAKKSLADSLHIKKGSSCPRLFLFRIS